MTWNPDAPLDLLNRSSLVYIELCGHEAYRNWLEQELPRVKIYLKYKSSVIFVAPTEVGGARDPQQPAPTAVTGAASDIIDEMVEALRWYADMENHIPRPGAANSEVTRDGGERAQRVMKKYEPVK